MANAAWPGVKTHATVASGGTNSTSFNVPEGCRAMTIWSPALGGTTTYKLQALDPSDGTTWVDLYVKDSTSTATALASLGDASAARATTIAAGYYGGGTLRIVLSAAAGSNLTFSILFS